MKTLIELYDECPIENVLGTEQFMASHTVFICPPEISDDKAKKAALEHYFEQRGCNVRLTFVPVSLFDANSVARELERILSTYEDCCLDISGGTDAALFAAGAVSGDTPVITYSWKKNTFYAIHNAPFEKAQSCRIKLDVSSCFLMAGGILQPGRTDNAALKDRLDMVDTLFGIYSQFRKIWNRQISYLQKISSASDTSLRASGPRTLKADARRVTVDDDLLKALSRAGFIQNLSLQPENVSFRFLDDVTRFWLRDMGCALELHVYRACLLSGVFHDVVLSAVVHWNPDEAHRDIVSNEIDVMAVRDVFPVFISCKTCEIRTEALNELAILRDRFGGKGSRAIIVTTESPSDNSRPMHNRAYELGIEVIEWQDLPLDRLIHRLKKARFYDPAFSADGETSGR